MRNYGSESGSVVLGLGNTSPAPGTGNVGHIDTTIKPSTSGDLAQGLDWDNNGDLNNDPSARATFGLSSGNKANIYKMQVYPQP